MVFKSIGPQECRIVVRNFDFISPGESAKHMTPFMAMVSD